MSMFTNDPRLAIVTAKRNEAQAAEHGRQVVLRVPDFAATWCYALEWQTTAADGAAVKGVLHGTLH